MSESFWSDAGVEPKRQYRWLFYMGHVPQWVVKKVTKPSFEVSQTTHEFLIHKFHYPGRVTWNEVKVTLADPVNPDSAATMLKVLQNSGYVLPLDPNTTQTLSKKRAVTALGHVAIEQYGAEEDEVIEKWVLRNAWVKDVALGELAYDGDEMVDVELTIVYDWAEMTIGLGRGLPT